MYDQSKDFQWFIENYDALYEKYGVSYLLIKDRAVIDSYATAGEAFRKGIDFFGACNFIIQYCNGNESAYNVYIASTSFM